MYHFNHYYPYLSPYLNHPYEYESDLYLRTTDFYRHPELEGRITTLEKQNGVQKSEITRLNQEIIRQNEEIARQNKEFTRINTEIGRMNKEIQRLSQRW